MILNKIYIIQYNYIESWFYYFHIYYYIVYVYENIQIYFLIDLKYYLYRGLLFSIGK